MFIIIIAILCALVMTFYSGYLAGMRHADVIQPDAIERTELQIPVAVPEPVRSEAVKPAVVAPGANIDVDVPDARPAAVKPAAAKLKPTEHRLSKQEKATVASTVSPVHKAPAKIEPADPQPAKQQIKPEKQKPAVTAKLTIKQETTVDQNSKATAETGTTASESEAEAKLATAEGTASQILDDASRDDARYSIQIGIYGSKNNASKQVDSLSAQHLSGYYQTYQNQNDEARYRVRFGYFSSYTSASHALEIWNKNHPDSRSYIVRLLR